MSDPETTFVAVAEIGEIAPNGTRAFTVAGQEILVCRVGADFYAVENRCSHLETPLTKGRIRGDCIVCPVHGARFSLKDGRHLAPPAWTGIRTFPVRVVGGQVEVSPVPRDPPDGTKAGI